MNEITTAAMPNRRRRIVRTVVAVCAAALAASTASVATATADDSREQTMDLPGGDIHVVTTGSPDTDAVVLLHGLAASTSWWDPVVPDLRGRYVVRIDLLGHGKSDKPDSGYSIPEQADRVAAVLDRLGVRHATVFGHSSGGYVATSLAEQRHDLVKAIGVLDTGPRSDAFVDNGPVGNLLFVPAIGQPLWPLLPDAALRSSLGSAFTRDVPIPDQLVADLRGMTYRSLTAASEASTAYLLQEPEPDRLADLGLPVMVVYGTQDRRWQPASFEDYRRVPRVRIEPLDCGHTPMIEEPDITGNLMRDFADRN